MIRMCLITPTSHLQQFASQSDGIHLCLASLVEEQADAPYLSFYRQRKEAGEYIIMDNMAFEHGEPVSTKTLLDKAVWLKPHAMVLPDFPGQPWQKTVESAQKFMEEARQHPYFKKESPKWLFVPQSERGDIDGWVKAYQWADSEPDVAWIGMSILGIPNAWNRVPPHLSRYYCGEYLLSHNLVSSKQHHYLGSFGYPNEYQLLTQQGIAYSSDTSSPVWHGYHGIAYDTSRWGLQNGKMSSKVDFASPKVIEGESDLEAQARDRIIQGNIDYLKRITR